MNNLPRIRCNNDDDDDYDYYGDYNDNDNEDDSNDDNNNRNNDMLFKLNVVECVLIYISGPLSQ